MITKLVRCVETTDFWGNEGDEAHITANCLHEIENMIPRTWGIMGKFVPQEDIAGIEFLERYDNQSWRLGNNSTV